MRSYPLDLVSVGVLIANLLTESLELSLRPFELVIPMSELALFDVKVSVELLIRRTYKTIFWL
jgi:hypothetical protein